VVNISIFETDNLIVPEIELHVSNLIGSSPGTIASSEK